MYSSLATVYIPSPFYGARNATIDTITIHHMAGDFTVETCGNIFQREGRNASSNYGIGTDGRIACYVDEEHRAKTSSNWRNDARSITIEVANNCYNPWTVSDVALSSLINLLIDVCYRRGIYPLKWSDNKTDRVNHKNGCNMTVHRDFTATICPSDYLMYRMSYIAEQVNAGIKELIKDDTDENVDSSFLVRVTATVLNIRKGAGTSYKIVGTVKRGEVFTIVETTKNKGLTWGRLKSGAGWICLKYTEPINIKA